ncbi:MAG: FecR domain-containing protein [Prevotellaceae bacterium]|jgi:ferric-dicitrate binding protein FerR (iron transport regulator)|nr:FecR domain-containing protein [Prevotellaceae bacterium]
MSKVSKIIQEYFRGVYPEHVRRNFASWLMASKDFKEKDESLLEVWNSLEANADASTEKSFLNLQSRIVSGAKCPSKKSDSFVGKLCKVAVVLLLPLLSATATWFYMKGDAAVPEEIRLIECIVPNGEIRNIVLPDSSRVTLNAGSILVYPQRFVGNTRIVYLNGEAFFNIVRNEDQPFSVNTVDMEIAVLGTVFNISSYIDGGNSSATLESGRINVSFKNGDYPDVALSPSERVVYDRVSGFVEKRIVKVENIIAWTKGNVVLQGAAIEEIAKIIERRYGMNVLLNSNKYQNERITLKLDDEAGLDELMNVLHHLIPGLHYKTDNNKLYIY